MAPKSSGCPRFGCVRERLVSLIKRAFLLNLRSDRLSRDLFATIVAETEAILNSRPLTHVSSDLDDDLPLTPNHFLMGLPFVYAPAAAFYEASKSKLSNKSWKRAKDRLTASGRVYSNSTLQLSSEGLNGRNPRNHSKKMTSYGYLRTLHHEASGHWVEC